MRNRERLERLGHFVGGDARHSSLAAATAFAAAFPYRDLIVLTAFTVVLDMTMGPATGRKPCGREFLFVDFVGPRARRRREGQLVQSVPSKGQEKGNLWRHASLLYAFLSK